MTKVQARLSVKPNSIPKVCRAKATSYALNEAIEQDLIRLQQMVIGALGYTSSTSTQARRHTAALWQL